MSSIIRVLRIVILTGLFVALPASLLFAQDVGERVVKRGTIDDDIYLAGGEVELFATVNGDATVAGGQLNLEGDVKGDVTAAGGLLILRGSVADDARLAGGNVQVRGSVGDDVVAAGGRVRLAPNARVGGRVWLTGGDILVDGHIGQELRAGGGRVMITGEVQGDVFLQADQIEIGPNAVITGQLHTKGPREARIAEGARIDGEVRHTPIDIPVASVAARIIGVGLALLLLAIYLIMLLLGYLVGALFVGEAGLRLIGKKEPGKAGHAIALSVALVALLIVGLIPLLGGLIAWLVLLAGMGAMMRQIYLTYKGSGS